MNILVFREMQRLLFKGMIVTLLLTYWGCDKSNSTTPEDNIVIDPEAYYVDQDHPDASDTNDGHYKDKGGTGPWKTLNYAIFNLKAGDLLYIRKGKYVENYPMYLKDNYTNVQKGGNSEVEMNAESGTVENPVEVRNYPNEVVEIDLKNVSQWIALDNKSYWNFSGLKFINTQAVFNIGEDSKSEHNTFKNIEVYRDRGGDNSGAINVINSNGEYTVIENCKIIGTWENTDNLHGNTNGLYARIVNHLEIRNCEISNMPIGIYYKHANSGESANLIIENNFIYNTTRNAMQVNAVNAIIENNIFGPDNMGILSSEANGAPGGDGNSYINNTFYQTNLALSSDTQSGDPNPGSLNNNIYDNLFYESKLDIHNYSTLAHNTTIDYNLYTGATPISEFGTDYSLDNWKSHYGSDQHSVSGTITFTGEASPVVVTDFSISGLGAGSDRDGKDIGADVSKVGYKENLN